MPATINPVRKALVKKSLLKGNSIRQALADGGYAPGTQRGNNNGTDNRLVKTCQQEIEQDIKKQITVESVLKGLCHIQDLATKHKDFSTAKGCEELKGKWLQMFGQLPEASPIVNINLQFSIDRLKMMQSQSQPQQLPTT